MFTDNRLTDVADLLNKIALQSSQILKVGIARKELQFFTEFKIPLPTHETMCSPNKFDGSVFELKTPQ